MKTKILIQDQLNKVNVRNSNNFTRNFQPNELELASNVRDLHTINVKDSVKFSELEERSSNQKLQNKRVFQKSVANKFRLNDYDLIKLCIETNPKYLSQIAKIGECQSTLLTHKK